MRDSKRTQSITSLVAASRWAGAAAVLLAVALGAPGAARAVTVCIDPGHGGPYNHANAHGLKEKNVNLWIARELRARLVADGLTVVMTRDADVAVTRRDVPTWHYSSVLGWRAYCDGRRGGDPPYDDLQARCAVANAAGADLFISIHNNASIGGGARGAETFAAPKDAAGRQLSGFVQSGLVHETGLRDRGAKTTDFYVLRWTNMPAVLVETAFVTSGADARLLARPSFRKRIAAGIANGIERWLAIKPLRRLYPRYAGPGPADVAAAASRAGFAGVAGTVLLISAQDATSAMTAAPLAVRLAAPVLVTETSTVPTATLDELARLHPGTIVAIGAEGSISDAALEDARAAAGASSVRRIAGGDAYATAALIADEVGVPSSGIVAVAPARSFARALMACGAAAGPVPVLLVGPGSTLPTATADFLAAHAGEVSASLVFGSATDVSPKVLALLPGAVRVAGSADVFEANASALMSRWKTGALYPIVATALPSASGVVAAAVAARSGRPLLLTGGRSMALATRQWLVRTRSGVRGLTLVGTAEEQPALADWLLNKALR